MTANELTLYIKKKASELGFDECKICPAEKVDELNTSAYISWIGNKHQGNMQYLENNIEKRFQPDLLVEGAKSIVVFAMNYYPERFQKEDQPQIAYYAYGKDYHDVIKNKLKHLYNELKVLDNNIEGRYFCDTAPVMERYWAQKAGIGWIGKNSLLIIPKKGSYFFLSCLILNKELTYDVVPKMPNCVTCTKCIDACPTQAIVADRVIDANKCLSYQTIENKGEIDEKVIKHLNNRFYGCDICQQVCPWNRFSIKNVIEEFTPKEELLHLTAEQIETMSVEKYQELFKGSAMKRAKLTGLKRNIKAWKQYKTNFDD